MSSLLCLKQDGGSVHVHDNDVIRELAVDSQDHTMTAIMNKIETKGRKSRQGAETTNGDTGMDSQSLIGQTMRVQDWLNEKTVKGLQFSIPNAWLEKQEKSDIETREARKLYEPLLQTEDTFVKNLEEYITYKDVMEQRKKEMLHKKWNDRVFEPLRKNIIDAMDSDDWPELDRRKRELHKQYLEFTNQKGHVFLDTMDPEEYYAQALNGHRPAPIKHACAKWDKRIAAAKKHFDHQHYKVSTAALRDPLLSQGRQRSAEDRTILRCITGYSYTDKDLEQVKLPPLPLVPLGRHGTDSLKWLEMPLHNIESTPRMASRRRMRGTFNTSNLDYRAWEDTPQDNYQRYKEMQIQRKRIFQETPPFEKPKKNVRIIPPNPPSQELMCEFKEPHPPLQPHPPVTAPPETLAVKAVQFTDSVPMAVESS
ncbi:protein FAM228B-like isoform X2 [Mizuhopecten yessoensis]|uniref:protein FAM228B-like isoform X2 n=1 Tax=Mizuhopecten yessoensis TaxID=6573 RepID=UPI000B45DCD9|nr:protein FAM228B-like isoform X2 [Mizuhopecten yessoensis]